MNFVLSYCQPNTFSFVMVRLIFSNVITALFRNGTKCSTFINCYDLEQEVSILYGVSWNSVQTPLLHRSGSAVKVGG